MVDPDKKNDDEKFNETLKRMLETPPKPHGEKADKGRLEEEPDRRPNSKKARRSS